MRYFFILGRQPELSVAELSATFKRNKIKNQLLTSNKEFAIFDIEKKIDAEKLINRLGGTIKIGEIISETTSAELIETLKSSLPETGKKIIFGINDYTGKHKPINLSKQIKKTTEKSMRFVYPQDGAKYLSSVATEKNKLLTENGIELNLFPPCHPEECHPELCRRALEERQSILIGKTLTVQPFETFSKLDYGRPGRDAESGMLPPKVATMMLNLSEAKSTDEILDPFCGSGTILQQALLLDFKHVTGTDLSEKAIEDSRKNIAWLKDQTGQELNVKIEQADARQLTAIFAQGSIDAIVTEPFLGKPIWGNEPLAAIKKQAKELEAFYIGVFKQLSKILSPTGSLVIIIPSFVINNTTTHLNIEKIIGKTDFKLQNTWAYSRPGQHVIRNICKFSK